MDTRAVHIGHTMIETVEPLLLRPPVEPVGPVLQQSTQVVKINALRPRPPRRRIGPARASNALPQVVENCVGHRDDERLDAHLQIITSVMVNQRSSRSATNPPTPSPRTSATPSTRSTTPVEMARRQEAGMQWDSAPDQWRPFGFSVSA